MEWSKQQSAIMTDNLSDSVGLTDATTRMLLCLLREECNIPLNELISLLQKNSVEVITAQSGMAALVNLYNKLFSTINNQSDTKQNIEQLNSAIIEFTNKSIKYHQSAYKNAAALIPDNATVMTHSFSSTILKALRHAKKTGKKTNVIVLESRPLLDGRQLAQSLIDNDINTTLIVDAALYTNLPEVDIILLDSDSLTESGVVSKIGSASMAICAQKFDIPCYVLSDSFKIWPTRLGEQPIHERSPSDVWQFPPEQLVIQNRIYDVIPWSIISGVITEAGLQTSTHIRMQCQLLEVTPRLIKVIAEVRSTI